ncbi:MAG: hypothetical protein WDN24_15615 [Sphingomonas sp.]
MILAQLSCDGGVTWYPRSTPQYGNVSNDAPDHVLWRRNFSHLENGVVCMAGKPGTDFERTLYANKVPVSGFGHKTGSDGN